MTASQLVQFPLRSGLDEKTDPKNAPPGTITSLVNMRQDKTGQFVRRYGHTALSKSILAVGSGSSGSNLSACKRLATRQNELLLSDGASIYGYSETLTKWVAKGKVPNCVSRFDTIKQFDSDWTDPQYAYANGLEVFSCTLSPNNAILAIVRDVASGVTLSPPLIIGSLGGGVYQSAVCIVGAYAVVCWGDSGGIVHASVMDLGNMQNGWSSPITLASDAITAGTSLVIHDVVAPHTFVLVYLQAFGGSAKAAAINATVTSGSAITVNTTATLTGMTSTTIGALCIDYDSINNLIYFGASLTSTNRFRVSSIDATALTTSHTNAVATAAQAGQAGIVVVSPTDIRFLFTQGARTNPNLYYTTDNTLGAFTLGGTFYFGRLRSNLWTVGSAVYCSIRYAKTHFVCELVTQSTGTKSPIRPTCTMCPRTAFSAPTEASGDASINNGLPRVYGTGNNHYRVVGTQISDSNLNTRNGLVIHDVTFGDDWLENGAKYPAQNLQPVEFGSLLHMSGGIPTSYDGNRLVEQSFLCGPQLADFPTPTPANTGGSLGQGSYQYQFTYEWTDDCGNVYRSEPSPAYSVTTSGVGTVNKVTWTIPCLFLTMKSTYPTTGFDAPSTQVAVIAYRTTVNGDGSLFYRQTAYTVPSTNLSTMGGQYVTIVDTLSDADLTASGAASLLYTNGDTQAWQAPPSLTCLIKHRRRVCGIGDDGRTVWFSSEFVDREAFKWNDNLLIEFDEPLTALASLDDRLLAFSRDNIWFITGDGPNDLGQGSDWSAPVRVQSDSGCVDPRSVISMADGVMFRSYTGYYFIDRSLNVSYLGGMIEDTADANLFDVCSLFQAHGETSCFISVLPATDSGTGIRLHWDTYRRMWAKDQLTDGATVSAAVAGLASWKGSVVWATQAGQVYQQSFTQWTDGSSWYDSSFITAFISAAGELGFQRVRNVQVDGDWKSNHDVRMSFGFDFDDNYVQSYKWEASSILTKKEEYVRMRVGSQNGANPRCEGIRLKVEILTPTTPSDYPVGTGQSASISGIGLEIVPKPGQRRLRSGVMV